MKALAGQRIEEAAGRNPNWTRDELILALDLYVRHRPAVLGNTSAEVIELSDLLNRLARRRRSVADAPERQRRRMTLV